MIRLVYVVDGPANDDVEDSSAEVEVTGAAWPDKPVNVAEVNEDSDVKEDVVLEVSRELELADKGAAWLDKLVSALGATGDSDTEEDVVIKVPDELEDSELVEKISEDSVVDVLDCMMGETSNDSVVDELIADACRDVELVSSLTTTVDVTAGDELMAGDDTGVMMIGVVDVDVEGGVITVRTTQTI